MNNKEKLQLLRSVRAVAANLVYELTQSGAKLSAVDMRLCHQVLITCYERLGLTPPVIKGTRAISLFTPLVTELEKLLSMLQDRVAVATKASKLEDPGRLQDLLIAAGRYVTTLKHCRTQLSVGQTRMMTNWLDQTSQLLSLKPPVFSWKTPSEKVFQLISAFEAIVVKLQEKLTYVMSKKKKKSP